MRIAWMLSLVVVPCLVAQEPADTGGGVQAARLRQQIRQRWNAQVRRQLDLTDDQAAKLQATEDRFLTRRRVIALRQRAVMEALRDQLRPGAAANSDSVRKLMDAREENRAGIAQIERDEGKDMAAYLSPVQLARYQLMRQRLQERITEMRRQRRDRWLGPGAPRER